MTQNRRSAPLACGIDVVNVPQFKRALALEPAFVYRVFTEQEIQQCANDARRLAAHFAAKEAAAKALGTGIRGVDWRDFEVISRERRAPLILKLHGRAAQLAAQLELVSWNISLSTTRNIAIATVVATAE